MIFSGKIPKYAQGMGATDESGFVVSFPFSVDATNVATLPKMIWVDSVNGNDSYNGFSPYAGFRLNGNSSTYNYQANTDKTLATGVGSADASYGPKKTWLGGYLLIGGVGGNRIGYQIFLSEGGTFYESSDFQGFIDDGSGGGSYSGVAGNVVTVTSINGGCPITPGTGLYISGAPVFQNISAYGTSGTTGTGGTGTYRFAGTPRAVAPQNLLAGSTDNFGLRSGYSVDYPFCVQSYTVADPLNTALHGRATGSNRPKIYTAVYQTIGSNYGTFAFSRTDNPLIPPRGNFAIRGISFDSGTTDTCGVSWGGNPYNVLFENCIFPGSALGVGSSVTEPAKNIIFRHCSMWGNWSSTGGHPGGIGTGHDDRLVVEDCIVWHTGWPLANPRRDLATFTGSISGTTLTVSSLVADTPLAIGQTIKSVGIAADTTITGGSGLSWTVSVSQTLSSRAMGTTDLSCPDIFKQGAYASYGSNDQNIYRRNVMVDNSASGLSGRGSILAYHNVMIDNPIQMVAGGSVNGLTGGYSTENPSGVDFNYHHNLIMGGADITSTEIRGQGISTQNGRPGSCVKANLFINNPNYAAGVAYAIQPDAAYNQPSYCEISGNYLYNYTPTLIVNGGGAFTAQRLTTYDGLVSPSPSGGTNPTLYGTNKLWDSSSSPYTNAQIYTALQGLGYGSGDKATLMAAMVATPELPWAERVLAQVGTMFGFDFALS